jgi:hypothetical protein
LYLYKSKRRGDREEIVGPCWILLYPAIDMWEQFEGGIFLIGKRSIPPDRAAATSD